MRLHHERLRARGWSDAEINRAEAGLKRAETRKHPAYAFLEKGTYWALLLLTLVGIFTVSAVIVPVLLVLDTSIVAIILGLLGLCLGSLFAILIQDIEWMERRHHAFNLLVLGLVATANIWLIAAMTDRLGAALGLEHGHAELLLGLVFALTLLTPYLFHLLAEDAKRRAKR